MSKKPSTSESGTNPPHTNRLARETSPYLLQHQHNPVDWYAWGDEAFERARREDKPIFLSVGYSTCYWCHVMERQSFENDHVAAEMNRLFINIKVDREERPDVDQLYMTAVQVLTRHGGWPMSVFLLPDLRPFYGGTYYPPTDQHGRPGFVTLIRALEDAYRNRRDEVDKSSTQIVSILRQLAEPTRPAGALRIDEQFIRNAVAQSIADYDPQHGGFGGAPKFPRETLLELLLVYLATADDRASEISNLKSQIRPMVLHTLDVLARGGIRDQLGGGFHRYSTDAEWLVPHFEIMLYDNAMLGWCYVEAYRQTEDRRYAEVARGVFDFILREMTSPDGAFYTAFDAEVDAQEGLSYLWTAYEVRRELTDEPAKGMGAPFSDADAELFLRVYGLNEGPNFADPHHGSGRPDKNILFIADPALEQANADLLARMRRCLLEARSHRKQPLLDTKVITSWNALMIRALAYGGQVLQEQRYVDAAARAADYLLLKHRASDGGLYRTSRDGVAKHGAFLDDYAFLIQAMLALHDAGANKRWNDTATALAEVMTRKFGDASAGGFYFTEAGAADLIVRQKVASDSPLPSGNAVAAMALLALGQPESARRTIEAFAAQVEANGEGMSSMVQAALLHVREDGPLAVEGARAAAADRPLSPQQVADEIVSVTTEWAGPQMLSVRVAILNGFHINAHEPSAGLLATQLSVSGDDASRVAAIDYPPGELQRFAFADDPIHVYSREVTIAVRFSAALVDRSKLRLALRYQACDDSACLPPVTKTIDVV